MDHRTEHHTPGCQKYIHHGSVPPVGKRGLVSLAVHLCLGPLLPPVCKHTSIEPLSGFLFSFQMCTKVSSAADSS